VIISENLSKIDFDAHSVRNCVITLIRKRKKDKILLDYKTSERLLDSDIEAKNKISVSNLQKIVNIINGLSPDLLLKDNLELLELVKTKFLYNQSGLEEKPKFKEEPRKMSREELLQQAIDDLDILLQSDGANWQVQAQKVREKLELAKELPIQQLDTWAARVSKTQSSTASVSAPSADYSLSLPSLEENLAKVGIYVNRENRKENPIEFLERCWGKYLNRFNGGNGDFLYQDKLRVIDVSLINGINNFRRGKSFEVSDFIPEKSARVKKETEELLTAVDTSEGDLSMKQKIYRLQKAAVVREKQV
jgi:hypothetical protein